MYLLHSTAITTYASECTKVQNLRRHHLVNTIMHMHGLADCTYGFQWREYWISAMEWFQNPQSFRPQVPPEYVTVFSGRTDTPEVRCNLTDTQTETSMQ